MYALTSAASILPLLSKSTLANAASRPVSDLSMSSPKSSCQIEASPANLLLERFKDWSVGFMPIRVAITNADAMPSPLREKSSTSTGSVPLSLSTGSITPSTFTCGQGVNKVWRKGRTGARAAEFGARY